MTAFKKTVHLEGGKAVVLQALTRRDASGMAWLDLMLTRIEEGRSADAGAAFIPLGASEVLPVAGDVNAAMLPVAPPQAINCRVNGRRTTLKLEAAFAKGLAVIADAQGVSQDELLSQIERANEEAGQPYNLASATRVYTLQWFFMQGRSEAHEAPES